MISRNKESICLLNRISVVFTNHGILARCYHFIALNSTYYYMVKQNLNSLGKWKFLGTWIRTLVAEDQPLARLSKKHHMS